MWPGMGRDRGADELTLDVHAENHRAQGAYRKVGFVATGERLERHRSRARDGACR
jgi:ribosomal protein S18 acetylase RimI-like enzyme